MNKRYANRLSQQVIKDDIAFKLKSGDKLSNFDKEDIYYFLTGEVLDLKKRGRPQTKVRDYRMALSYITDAVKSNFEQPLIKGKIKKALRIKLKKQYRVDSMSDNAFYAAITRGMKSIRERAEMWLDKLENDKTLVMSEADKERDKLKFKNHLVLVENYKEKNIIQSNCSE